MDWPHELIEIKASKIQNVVTLFVTLFILFDFINYNGCKRLQSYPDQGRSNYRIAPLNYIFHTLGLLVRIPNVGIL
jgi:hypothetical protein